jgi:hypothetical protein
MGLRVLRLILLASIFVVLISAFFGLSNSVAGSNAGRTAADFLLISPDANSAGMGGAYSAITSGASSAFWNPARLPLASENDITLSHFLWYQGIKLDHGAASFRVGKSSAIAASFTMLNYGTIDAFDANGNPNGQVSSNDWQGSLSFGMKVGDNMSLGVTGKYVAQRLAEVQASALAADIGFAYQIQNFSFSAVAANLSQGMKFVSETEKLPSLARFGLAFTPTGSSIVTSIDVEKRFYGDLIVRTGAEFNLNEKYFLRGGLNYRPNNDGAPLRTGITFGAGIRYNNLGFDYAFSPKDSYTSNELHRFSLVISWGQ